MRVVMFGNGDLQAPALALEASGLEVEQQALPGADGTGASAALVAGLRGAEASLAGSEPGAVLVSGTNDASLAVALTAVKLQIPTAWLDDGATEAESLVGRVADATLDASADAADLASRVKDLAARRLPAP